VTSFFGIKGAFFSKITRRICTKIFSGFKRKHLCNTNWIEKQCTQPLTYDKNGYTTFRRDHHDADFLIAALFDASPSHPRPVFDADPFRRKLIKNYTFRCIFFFFGTRGMLVCVFADKLRFNNLICVGYTFYVDSLQLCSQIYKRKFNKFNYNDLFND